MRTIPPYLAALLVSYLAVSFARRQQFDIGYLLFIQNYYDKIPYFSVSWALCVEEHFYLVAPIAFAALQTLMGKRAVLRFTLALILSSPLIRWLTYVDSEEPFGYAQTATHLRMEGLLLGFLLSYLSIEAPSRFQSLSRASLYVAMLAGSCLILLVIVGGAARYALWGTLLASFFAAVLVSLVTRRPIGSPLARVAQPVAAASYSIYLTHAWAVYVATELIKRAPAEFSAVYFLMATLGIAIIGACFYWAVERSSIRIRDAAWPRRIGPNTKDAGFADLVSNAGLASSPHRRPGATIEPGQELRS
jgi:peptidoglycan/LPS O-acetylase OafA/YrhL